jgi:glucose-6-phosphate-specific signal transduction histidine kinase
MFFPVVWLSLRYGWHGAAVGGSASSIAVVLTMPAKYDLGTLQAQVFIAFSITTMLLLGERIASLHRREMLERDDAQWSMALARRTLVAGELQLRQTSTALEHVREAVQLTFAGLLDKLRVALPTSDERDLRIRAAVTQQQLFRLADSLHPVTWRDSGFSSALRHGAIARALDEAGIQYWPRIDDRELGQLSESLQIAIYRLACDLIALACAQSAVSSISLRVRSFHSSRRRAVAMRIDICKGRNEVGETRLDDLFLRLASTGPAVEVLRDRVALFEGRLKVTDRENASKTSLIVFDPA